MTSRSANGGSQRPGARRKGTPAGRRHERGSAALPSERREHLVRLAAELFARKGFQATTVREIADEAGILSGSLYHHFDSKESIVDEVLSAYYDELMAADRAVVDGGGDPRQTLAELVRVSFGTLRSHRAAVTVMQNDWHYLRSLPRFEYLGVAEDEVQDLWAEQMARGQRAGLFREDVDPALTYRMVRDTIWVAVRWFRPGERLDTEGLAEHYLKVLFDGICTH